MSSWGKVKHFERLLSSNFDIYYLKMGCLREWFAVEIYCHFEWLIVPIMLFLLFLLPLGVIYVVLECSLKRQWWWLFHHSVVQFFGTPWTAAHQASLSFTISPSLLKLMSIESVITIQPSHPLSSPSPLAFSHSQHQGLELVLQIRWPKYWRFSFSPSNECSGLISFRVNWFDFLAVQWTLKNLLQHRI